MYKRKPEINIYILLIQVWSVECVDGGSPHNRPGRLQPRLRHRQVLSYYNSTAQPDRDHDQGNTLCSDLCMYVCIPLNNETTTGSIELKYGLQLF